MAARALHTLGRMLGGALRGIELIDVGRRHRRRPAAGPQILRMHVGIAVEEFHFTPAPPAALVAAVWLMIGQLLTQPLEAAAQTGRVDPRGGTPRTLHTGNLLGSPVMLPQPRSCVAR
ncbi:MAG: hypothetical protein DMF84_18275 [Acidobacteria bacterium]|nr:MAG: hypothetical protein DMF84_18275 [Acidobacteriota bacterium]